MAATAARTIRHINQDNEVTVSGSVKRPVAIESGEDDQKGGVSGRPRSEKSKSAIIDTTNRMLLTTPVREVSIEAIARKAGVGKTTIYRWWPNKLALILDAIAGPMNVLPAPVEKGAAKDRLVRQIERFSRICRGRGGKIVAEVYAEAQGDPALQSMFFEKFMLQHEEILAAIIQDGKDNGEFRKELDTVLAVDMIYGAIFYHLMSSTDPMDQAFSDALVMESLRILK